MSAEEFLKNLSESGGAIISSSDCTPEEIEAARIEGRFFADDDNDGYVWEILETAE